MRKAGYANERAYRALVRLYCWIEVSHVIRMVLIFLFEALLSVPLYAVPVFCSAIAREAFNAFMRVTCSARFWAFDVREAEGGPLNIDFRYTTAEVGVRASTSTGVQ